jgi:predicted NACHT family NTPase
MAKRSIQASPAGVKLAKQAFTLKGWTQENLAEEVNLKTRQPIWRFFTGKPIDRQIFIEVCSTLNLVWQDIADEPPLDLVEPEVIVEKVPPLVDAMVQQVRLCNHDGIQDRCGIVQLLDMSRPVSIDDIYVDVNILEEISSLQCFELADLQSLNPSEFDRAGLGAIDQKQIPGMQAVETHSKLRVLGKPGVGKTTFLQHLAIQCNRGSFAVHQVPVFITARELAEESRRIGEVSLFDYISAYFLLPELDSSYVLETLLQAGRILLLLDGIDEVLNRDITVVLKEIRKFSDKYHRNRFIISCRTASHKLRVRGFTDVEIAPFTQSQITSFTQKWFTACDKKPVQLKTNQSVQLMQTLDLPENWQFRQLVVTPLFLHLACWVFQGQGKLPTKKTEFYKQGLDLLLGKWDEARGVERDDVYRGFLLPQKMRLLSQLATVTFEQEQYFFEQRVIEQYIGDYLQNLPDAILEPEELQLESEAILKAIEAQHGLLIERARGIFSFSYLVFQEYLTARKIVASHHLSAPEQALGKLVIHITDPHWHEIFLLTASMLRSADSLVQLMKQQIDAIVAQDPYLQEFLSWANQKSQQISEVTQLATTRAFYLALAKKPNTAEHFTLACTMDQGILLDVALESLLLKLTEQSQDFTYIDTCRSALTNILSMILDAGLYKSIQQLRDELPAPSKNREWLQDWLQTKHSDWLEILTETIVHYRNIHHPWVFSIEQQQVLQSYYDANQLLMDCLHSNCEVTGAIRKEIEATLLLPQKALEDREWQNH